MGQRERDNIPSLRVREKRTEPGAGPSHPLAQTLWLPAASCCLPRPAWAFSGPAGSIVISPVTLCHLHGPLSQPEIRLLIELLIFCCVFRLHRASCLLRPQRPEGLLLVCEMDDYFIKFHSLLSC